LRVISVIILSLLFVKEEETKKVNFILVSL
jgi:hypothetical protein